MGSSLSVVVLGVSSLDATTKFYRDVIGLDASEVTSWSGAEFERFWHLPEGITAKARMFSNGESAVGRILALEFDAPDRVRVVEPGMKTFCAFQNINFYVNDLDKAVQTLSAAGYELWDEPYRYGTSATTGEWYEAICAGPDGLAIVLLELPEDSETTVGLIGRMANESPRTAKGFSQVATTSHNVFDYDRARDFYEKILGMECLIDEIMENPRLNRLNGRPSDGRTHWGFMKGDSFYGKVFVSHPLNYVVPDRAKVAVAPNIGYLAQCFAVNNIDQVVSTCVEQSVDVATDMMELDIPGIGRCKTMMVLNPGSCGQIQLFETDSA